MRRATPPRGPPRGAGATAIARASVIVAAGAAVVAVVAVASMVAGCADDGSTSAPVASHASDAPTSAPEEPVATTAPPATTTSALVTTTTEPTATTTPVPTYVFPFVGRDVSYGTTHHDYPAVDVFGCGAIVVAPTAGIVLEISTTDRWDPAVNDPATRGGLFVSMLGDDGVRYDVAHLAEVLVAIDDAVAPGTPLGVMGATGNARGVRRCDGARRRRLNAGTRTPVGPGPDATRPGLLAEARAVCSCGVPACSCVFLRVRCRRRSRRQRAVTRRGRA